jgi:hypothetical protein
MNPFRNNQRVVVGALCTAAIFACILVYACNKKQNNSASPSEITRNYFTSLASQETSPVQQPPNTTKQIIGVKPRIMPLTKMSEHMLWDKAVEQRQGELAYTLIPLNEQIKPFKNKDYEFFRTVIVYHDRSNKENMAIVEVLGKKGASLGTGLQQIATTAFENKYFSRSNNISDISALIFFFNEKYEPDGSFQVENGTWSATQASFRSDLDITQ